LYWLILLGQCVLLDDLVNLFEQNTVFPEPGRPKTTFSVRPSAENRTGVRAGFFDKKKLIYVCKVRYPQTHKLRNMPSVSDVLQFVAPELTWEDSSSMRHGPLYACRVDVYGRVYMTIHHAEYVRLSYNGAHFMVSISQGVQSHVWTSHPELEMLVKEMANVMCHVHRIIVVDVRHGEPSEIGDRFISSLEAHTHKLSLQIANW
jgi:hypothetical protein